MLRPRLLAFAVAFAVGLAADFLVGFFLSNTVATLIGAVFAGPVSLWSSCRRLRVPR